MNGLGIGLSSPTVLQIAAFPSRRNPKFHFPLISTSEYFFRRSSSSTVTAITVEEIPPNAFCRQRDSNWRGGFSLGIDLGMSRTGLAISKGFSVRPLTTLDLRGQKLELKILDIAEQQEVDEFIVGIPKSCDGKETQQSNKVRSVAGRLAVRAAERGWRVYLQDEYGTSLDAMDHMLNLGIRKSVRQGSQDAYAAVMVLERYFSVSGESLELVVPKQLELQENLKSWADRQAKQTGLFSEDF
ncbi:putative pre-16S rRNA nuclease [Impatiens glandulifera]|uniref:putative pre-16S rRNA nuclease n=1 Tax=Impatiens glandulifera TaxID=253017 RepID=UPI001FB0C9BA|nr:putative pre-16S rRNA nuclease [Impatiens glandulifera]